MMKYYSTRNKSTKITFREATLKGMPDDNGLYMPEYIPNKINLLKGIDSLSFQDIAFNIANSFINKELNNSQLEDVINSAITFDVPLVEIKKNSYILELFHGPTLAFKDFGACFMARIMEKFVKDNDKHLNILVATSGDTGSAVANGFYDVKGINVIILYPSKKVSAIQEKQIATLDKNITALEVDGTFDDCQNLVKKAFLDQNLNSKILLSSANSINISRLIPQSFYYFYAYSQLTDDLPVAVSVPSGNFGNLTAGILSKFMGLPIKHFIASTNANDTVPNFLLTGDFNPKPSVQTISNAMDVGNPSNMKRILDIYDNFQMLKEDVSSWSFSDNETKNKIVETLNDNKYLLDPHGAVGLLGLNKFITNKKDDITGIVLGTAHPAKFSDIIEPLIGDEIEIPNRLKRILDKDKRAIYMKNSFDDFSDYLLTNFK